MKANYGFTCKMTAKPGMGDQLVKLVLTGLDEGNPGSSMKPVSDRDPAAIDREHDTVGERRLRRGQVDDGCGDLLRGA